MTLGGALTGPADLRDQRWLAERVEALGNGIEAARDIWANWFEGRRVARFHNGITPGEYIATLGLRLTLPEALAAMPEASSRQVAAVAGVSHATVQTVRRGQNLPTEPIRGSDGKSYPRQRTVTAVVIDESLADVTDLWGEMESVVQALRSFSVDTPSDIARAVPERRRAGTAKTLRQLGTFLGAIALELEGPE